MILNSTRSGQVIHQPTGYSAFLPAKLPPNPPIVIDTEMQALLSVADRKLGRLDGITQVLPNPDLFLAMYVKKEAILSSQIEGTQASLVDVLNATDKSSDEPKSDVSDVVNYVKAMNYGLSRLSTLPLSLRLIREIHAILLDGVRGYNKSPGEFRNTQNWIGPAGCTLSTATFVPPPAEYMHQCMGDLEKYFYDDSYVPALIKIAMIHAQFETIHPFLDGNGRVGRLLITFWLCQQQILSQPLLYLSYYFKLNRSEYYERLMNVRLNGDWENWIKFFLKGIAAVSDEATESAKAILALKEKCAKALSEREGNSGSSQRLLDYLFEQPIVERKEIADVLGISAPTANALVDMFCECGILVDVTPQKKRYKKYYFQVYLDILEKGTEL